VKTSEFVPGILQNTFLNIAEVLMQNLNIMLTISNWECLAKSYNLAIHEDKT